ncbi:hypothetical protein [Pseudomonas guariconensis]|uniref:hypothetical protein n=1 Tax=Pseudomonas guariconensis TaxID=1288410 RepID=UPI002F3FEEEB
MSFHYDRYQLMQAIGATVSDFFFRDAGEASAADLRERAAAMGTIIGRIQAVVAEEGEVGPGLIDEILRLENELRVRVTENAGNAIRPGGGIFQVIDGGRK